MNASAGVFYCAEKGVSMQVLERQSRNARAAVEIQVSWLRTRQILDVSVKSEIILLTVSGFLTSPEAEAGRMQIPSPASAQMAEVLASSFVQKTWGIRPASRKDSMRIGSHLRYRIRGFPERSDKVTELLSGK